MTRDPFSGTKWRQIATAPTDGRSVYARDQEGMERWTHFEDGAWTYQGWRENEDREEFECDKWWSPTEWQDEIKEPNP